MLSNGPAKNVSLPVCSNSTGCGIDQRQNTGIWNAPERNKRCSN